MSPFWRNRRVFVTGDTGFVGGWLVQALLSAGGAVEIHDANDLAAETVRLFTDPSHRAKLVGNAGIALQPHHGATARTAGLVENAFMGSDSTPARV